MCFACSRRSFVFGGLAASVLLRQSVALGAPLVACGAAMGGPVPSSFTSTSGDQHLDRALIAELRKIVRIIPVNPTFRYYDDDGSPNAMAWHPSGQLPTPTLAGTWGLVIIGLNLLRNEFATNLGGVAVAGILAHECTHIFQFTYQALYKALLRSRDRELHADYLAGAYFGREGTRSEQTIQIFANSLFNKGSYDFNRPGFHGTPEQRVRAMTIDSRREEMK
jgi:hypothetical protein